MIRRVWQKGIEEALAKLKRLRTMIRPAKVRLELQQRSVTILTAQAARGRNVTVLSHDEEKELQEIAERHLKAARDKEGREAGGDAEQRAMQRELGEHMRRIIADKIEDRRACRKSPLSAAYSARKKREWGRTKPILVASGDLLEDVREARVRVERGS